MKHVFGKTIGGEENALFYGFLLKNFNFVISQQVVLCLHTYIHKKRLSG